MARMPHSPAQEVDTKLAFLARADSYPDGADAIEVIETHFAWVFLSRRFAYKLKKPIREIGFDLTSLAARRVNCELEVSLNRRLAESVYLGVVPLVRSGAGWLLEAPGEPAEWLVKMQRLPHGRALDRAAANGAVRDVELTAVVHKLAAFYAWAARAVWTGEQYRAHLSSTVDRCTRELAALGAGLDVPRVHALRAAQLRFVDEHAALLEARLEAGRVVDAHGDLRPEHVFLCDPPQIIDCLEFSAELRMLDTGEEISFLILECERLGFGAIGARILEIYRRACADDMPPALLAFYRSVRALVRAVLAARRLHAPLADAEAARWRGRAAWYIEAAQTALVVSLRASRSAARG